MKNTLFFLFIISLIACNSIEQYRTGIEELGTKWDTTTQSINDLVASVQAEASNHANAIAGIQIDEKAFGKLKADDQAAITSSKESAMSAGAGFESLLTELNTVISEMTEKTAALTALKDGLASGKIEGDVAAQLAELSSFVDNVQGKLGGWADTFNTVKSASAAGTETLNSTIASLLAKK